MRLGAALAAAYLVYSVVRFGNLGDGALVFSAVMFHVEQATAGGRSSGLTPGGRRGRASSSATTIFFGGACAIITVRERFVKSFLRVCPKLF